MEATMRWFVPLLPVLSITAICIPAHSQLTPGGPTGDFRINDRSGTAATAGPAGGPSLPPNPMMFQDSLGSKSPDQILKSIDKDLGRSTLSRPDVSPPFNMEKELKESRSSLTLK